MEERIHIIIHGMVQGVFFRDNACDVAAKLSLKGWVRNAPEGNVEIVAEGEKERLKELLDWCHKGPRIAHVEKVDASWEKATGEFEKFGVKY